MQPIFEYLSYRIYLKEFYTARKKESPWFSYRYISKKVGIDPGYIVKIFQEKYHLAPKHIQKFCELCKLDAQESEYFECLVHFEKAKSQNQIREYFNKLLSFKELKSQQLTADQYEIYQKWHYSAIRSLIDYYDFKGDYKALGKKLSPPISAKEARTAVGRLEKLNLIYCDDDGRFRLTDHILTFGEKWHTLAIHDYQREVMRLAGESLDRHVKDDRDISSVTISIDRKDLPEIKEQVTHFRQSVLKYICDKKDENSVYQLNIQLYPLTQPEDQ